MRTTTPSTRDQRPEENENELDGVDGNGVDRNDEDGVKGPTDPVLNTDSTCGVPCGSGSTTAAGVMLVSGAEVDIGVPSHVHTAGVDQTGACGTTAGAFSCVGWDTRAGVP